MTARWNQHELDIVEMLARRVRLMSLHQIHDLWHPEVSLRALRRRLNRLRRAGLILRTTISAHPRLRCQSPLHSWTSGDPEPDHARVSRHARIRWTHESIESEVYTASPLAAGLFGSTSRQMPPLVHRDHDLLLAEVYVLYRRVYPEQAALWVGEDALPKAGYRIKDPDAFLMQPDGRIVRVVESAGRYDERRIAAFHEHCENWNLAYELW